MRTRIAAGFTACVAMFVFLSRDERTNRPFSATAAVVGYALPWMRQVDTIDRKPTVTPKNLRGYGALAIRLGRDLYIVDGDAPTWLVARSGSTPHRVPLTVRGGDRFGWPPRADVLWAGAITPPNADRAADASTRITPDGGVKALPTLAVPSAIRWSRSGDGIASYAFEGTLPYE